MQAKQYILFTIAVTMGSDTKNSLFYSINALMHIYVTFVNM